MSTRARLFGLAWMLCVGPVAAPAAEWPTAPIHVVVPFTPGASTDVVLRTIAPKLSELLGTSVVIENRGGAGGLIATEAVASAAPDGYTVLVVTTSFASQPAILSKISYDPLKSFSPVALLADMPGILVANPALPVSSFAEFPSYAKSHAVTYGSAGVGTFPHLGVELLKSRTGLPITHVPYKGAAQALTDVIAGHIDIKLDAYVSAHAHIASGKLKPLAVSSLTRLVDLPNVPTIDESGVSGFETNYWIGVSVPAGVPETIRFRLERAFVESLTPQNRSVLAEAGVRSLAQGSEALQALTARELEQWRKLAKETDLAGQ